MLTIKVSIGLRKPRHHGLPKGSDTFPVAVSLLDKVIMSQCPSAGTRLVVYYVYTSKQYIDEYTLSTMGPPADAGNRQVGSRMTCLAVSK